MAEILGATVPIVVYLPILPFELAIGGWLLIRGVRTEGGETRRIGSHASVPT